MRRFLVDAPLASQMPIQGEQYHHIVRVLRMSAGEAAILVAPDGSSGLAIIDKISADTVFFHLQQPLAEIKEAPVRVCLAQGLPKSDKMDYIVQKAVELGVEQIIPLATVHSVVRYDAAKQVERVKRWRKIAGEAAKQCGRTVVPPVRDIMTLPELVAARSKDYAAIMLYEASDSGRQGIKQVLSDRPSSAYLLFIGPEGGFSTREYVLCREQHIAIAGLGPRILRTETAAVAALTIVMYHCGDLGM